MTYACTKGMTSSMRRWNVSTTFFRLNGIFVDLYSSNSVITAVLGMSSVARGVWWYTLMWSILENMRSATLQSREYEGMVSGQERSMNLIFCNRRIFGSCCHLICELGQEKDEWFHCVTFGGIPSSWCIRTGSIFIGNNLEAVQSVLCSLMFYRVRCAVCLYFYVVTVVANCNTDFCCLVAWNGHYYNSLVYSLLCYFAWYL